MILELLAAGLIVSAVLAVHLDEAVYSIVSLTCTFILMAILYSLSDANFAAVFQLAISAGTLAVLFLSGEMLSEKPSGKKSLRNLFLAIAGALLLSIPSILLSAKAIQTNVTSGVSFPEALWNLRAIDVVLQGMVIMTVALGIAIVLYEKRGGKN
ncbi:MAG: NADH-quinone oxidoreductase subunit J [Candidatus Bathyarchaeota archaeon]|nr:NADH-quinone oxidoreductase subunit J [Candidatus Bathyarchaeota archaeon]MDH5788718.1 NADH-quinone oxidoreductase subunit J [Candidatus Bathyarchaeota archaeon]